jgi:hypothetical protein
MFYSEPEEIGHGQVFLRTVEQMVGDVISGTLTSFIKYYASCLEEQREHPSVFDMRDVDSAS